MPEKAIKTNAKTRQCGGHWDYAFWAWI